MKKYTVYKMMFTTLILIFSHQIKAQTSDNKMADIKINFQNFLGDDQLVLMNKQYLNKKGNTFNITTFNYFISNIKLQDKKGKEYIVPQDESYFLIKASDTSSQNVNLKIPKGKYTKLTFTVGVDSLRNTMELSRRTGVLDPSGGMINGMYWSWNTGYIFLKMEGNSDQAPLDKIGQHKFRYHIGGFGGYEKPGINNIKTITIDLSKEGILNANSKRKAVISIKTDAGKIFDGETNFSLIDHPGVMFSDFSTIIAKNYSQMFSHTATKYLNNEK